MRRHIVLIENNPVSQQRLKIILTEGDYRVSALAQVSTIEELMDMQADCFVLEERLPVISGHILCMILKAKPLTKFIPIVLLAAAEDSQSLAELSNADAILFKPVNKIKFLDLIDKLMKNNLPKTSP